MSEWNGKRRVSLFLMATMSAGLIGTFLLPELAADIIVMKNGSQLEGEIVDEKNGLLKVKVNESAIVEVPSIQVAKIIRKPTRFQELSKKKQALKADDVVGRLVLAKWCKKNFLTKESRKLFDEVIIINPENLEARRALGFVKYKGVWTHEKDFYKAKGFVRYRGRWIPKEEAEREKLKLVMKKRIHTLLKYYRRGNKKAVEASEEILSLKPKDIAGPLLLPYLDEKKDSIRKLIAEALGNTGYDAAALPLLEKALNDDAYSVARQAGKSLWRLKNTGTVHEAKKKLVQSLFNRYERVRLRSANIILDIGDTGTVPYLIEALYLRRAKRVTEVQESHGVVRGGNPSRGVFGQYNRPVQTGAGVVRTKEVIKFVYAFNPAARKALRTITKKDFDYDKSEWFEWWKKEGFPKYKKALEKNAEAAKKAKEAAKKAKKKKPMEHGAPKKG
jgi:hypothetical protein